MIVTDRLVLRRARPSDLEAFHDIMTAPAAMRYWSCPPHQDIAQTQEFLDYLINFDWSQREEYVVEYREKCVGKMGCWRRAELGFILHPDVWGLGIGREAANAVIPRAFAKFPDEPAILANVDPRNTRSVSLLESLGFSLIRTGKRDFLYGESEWCDTAYYRLARPQ